MAVVLNLLKEPVSASDKAESLVVTWSKSLSTLAITLETLFLAWSTMYKGPSDKGSFFKVSLINSSIFAKLSDFLFKFFRVKSGVPDLSILSWELKKGSSKVCSAGVNAPSPKIASSISFARWTFVWAVSDSITLSSSRFTIPDACFPLVPVVKSPMVPSLIFRASLPSPILLNIHLKPSPIFFPATYNPGRDNTVRVAPIPVSVPKISFSAWPPTPAKAPPVPSKATVVPGAFRYGSSTLFTIRCPVLPASTSWGVFVDNWAALEVIPTKGVAIPNPCPAALA